MASKQITDILIGFDRVFEIEDPINNRHYRGDVNLAEYKYVKARDIFKGKARPKYPLTIIYQMGGERIDDIIWTTLIGIGPIISTRILNILMESKFSGWSTYPVRVFSKSGDLVKGFHGLSIVGRCGPIDYSLSRRVKRPPLVPGGQAYEEYVGMFFHPKTWDGSDLFCPKDMTCILAVDHVVKALKIEKIKNLRYTRLDEYTIDVDAT